MATPESQDQAQKPEEQWTTGDEPITGPQKSYLSTLMQRAGEDMTGISFDDMTKAQASQRIEELQGKTGSQSVQGNDDAGNSNS